MLPTFWKKLDIHPLTTIILVLVGGDIGGIIAILLIIPLYMIVKILLTKVYNLFVKNHRAESEVEVEVEESL